MDDCEEYSCENLSTAICLHCMRHLCLYHIQDHQEIILDEINNIKNEAKEVNDILTNTFNNLDEERKTYENKCIHWRQQRIEEIECEYNKRMQNIIKRQTRLEQLKSKFSQRLEQEIQQPLEKSINPQLLHTIQLAIKTITKDINEYLKWNSDNNNLVTSLKSWKPTHQFFTLFRDISPGSVDRIHKFIQMMKNDDEMKNNGLTKLVLSYLHAWHKTTGDRGKYKELILSRHIFTIKQYITEKDSQEKVLIALQYFYNRLKQPQSNRKYYLQFYLSSI